MGRGFLKRLQRTQIRSEKRGRKKGKPQEEKINARTKGVRRVQIRRGGNLATGKSALERRDLMKKPGGFRGKKEKTEKETTAGWMGGIHNAQGGGGNDESRWKKREKFWKHRKKNEKDHPTLGGGWSD